MIRVAPAPEPEDFDGKVRQPGRRAIAEMVGAPGLPKRPGRPRAVIAASEDAIPADKFPPIWTAALPELLAAYGRVCAYMSFYIERVTGTASVDHMLPKSVDWLDIYEWRNYRLACSLMNSRKNDYQDVLDPFEIDDGWFRLELVGYQVIPDPNLPPDMAQKVQATIDRLKLNDYECLKLREEYAEAFLRGDVSQAHLHKRAPFLAREIERAALQEEEVVVA
jgi:hypothetical protein